MWPHFSKKEVEPRHDVSMDFGATVLIYKLKYLTQKTTHSNFDFNTSTFTEKLST